MIYIGEEFSYVTLQYPNRPRVVARDRSSVIAKTIQCPMRAFDATTGVRIKDEFWIEIRIQDSVNSVM